MSTMPAARSRPPLLLLSATKCAVTIAISSPNIPNRRDIHRGVVAKRRMNLIAGARMPSTRLGRQLTAQTLTRVKPRNALRDFPLPTSGRISTGRRSSSAWAATCKSPAILNDDKYGAAARALSTSKAIRPHQPRKLFCGPRRGRRLSGQPMRRVTISSLRRRGRDQPIATLTPAPATRPARGGRANGR